MYFCSRVLQYFNNKQEKDIVDPTGDLRWKNIKANKLGVALRIELEPSLPECPDVLKNELGEMKSAAGWTKSLIGVPTFDASRIKTYYGLINNKLAKKATLVKKHFERRSQLLEESLISVDSDYVKDTGDSFCLKSVCAAILKNKDLSAIRPSPCSHNTGLSIPQRIVISLSEVLPGYKEDMKLKPPSGLIPTKHFTVV